MIGLLRLPRGAVAVLKEVLRHILRRPVVGICAAVRTADHHWILVRRADNGQWSLPGGTVEWGETLQDALARELYEEAGIVDARLIRVTGVYSRPDRDPRFHAITVVVECEAERPVRPPTNPLEIREVQTFSAEALPRPLSMGLDDAMADVLSGRPTILE